MAETKKYRSLEQLKEIHDLIILFFLLFEEIRFCVF
jgi:hypothetical protein